MKTAFQAIIIFFLFICSVNGFAADQFAWENAANRYNDESIYGNYEFPLLKCACASYPDHYFAPPYLNPEDEDHLEDSEPPIGKFTKTALNEFKFLSGVNRAVCKAEKTVNDYSRKFKLTGEFDFKRRHDPDAKPVEKDGISTRLAADRKPAGVLFKRKSNRILKQFAFHKITWTTEFDLSKLSFKLGLCDALNLNACAGNDFQVGATVRVIF